MEQQIQAEVAAVHLMQLLPDLADRAYLLLLMPTQLKEDLAELSHLTHLVGQLIGFINSQAPAPTQLKDI
jgi:hypothetical protein